MTLVRQIETSRPAHLHSVLEKFDFFRRCFRLLCLFLLLAHRGGSFAIEVPPGFTTETLVTNLNAATALAVSPDGRIFIAEQTGRLLVYKEGRLLEKPALSLRVTDFWERGLIGLALHPDFPRTPQLFVLYVTPEPFVHHVLARFELNGDEANPASELILLQGDDQAKMGGFQPAGHQGGALCFGTDGKLYVSIGEQTASEPSQRLNTLIGKILRLNPDGSIPEDNPFYSQTEGKYRAIHAIGVRNSFGLAAQRETGRIFFTDVGGTAFEEVNELQSGANYGWPKGEGFSKNPEFKDPLHAYPPMVGRSIVGGLFYPQSVTRTGAFPERWRGMFFFGDFMNHWIKALDPAAPGNVVTFATGLNGPVALALEPDGSLLALNRGTIWRDPKKFVDHSGSLVRIRYTGAAAEKGRKTGVAALNLPRDFRSLPKKLSQTAVMRLIEGEQFPRAERFALNASPWEPGVHIREWFVLPPGVRMQFHPTEEWKLPPGTVVARHFEAKRPIETQIIVVDEPCGYGASFRWREDGTEADLCEDFDFSEVTFAGGRKPVRQWFFPAPEECLSLPTASLSYALQMNTRQLNRNSLAEEEENQISRWHRLDLLEFPGTTPQVDELPRLAALNDTGAPLELRVRSYLDANCAICHQPGGNSRSYFDARFHTPLEKTGLVNGALAAGDLGISGARVIAPGDPAKSILFRRMQATDFFRMPPTAYHDELSPVLPLLAEWIKSIEP